MTYQSELPPELPPQPVSEPNTGEILFQKISNLGVGRFYLSLIELTDPKPTSTDTLGRIERVLNGAPQAKMNLALPLAVSLPVNREETQHILVFQNGRMVLVQPLNPNENLRTYQENFDTHLAQVHSTVDYLLKKNQQDPELCIAKMKFFSYANNFTIVDPLDSDQNMQSVLNGLTQATKTAKEMQDEKQARQAAFQDKASSIIPEE